MMKPAAVAIAFTLLPALAYADQGTTTETANTLVVVTPTAPTIVVTGQASAAQALSPPGAQEQPPPPVTSAPGSVPWSEVSHINGQLVKVGEHTDYLYKIKKTNIGTNPIGAMFGFYDLSIQQAVSGNVAIRGDISVFSLDHGNYSGLEVSASLPIYFRRTYSGPFFEPGLVYHADNAGYGCGDCAYSPSSTTTNTRSWVGPQMMVGWSWIFDSGLNLAFAVGAAKPVSSTSMSYGSNEAQPAGYFRIGYAF